MPIPLDAKAVQRQVRFEWGGENKKERWVCAEYPEANKTGDVKGGPRLFDMKVYGPLCSHLDLDCTQLLYECTNVHFLGTPSPKPSSGPSSRRATFRFHSVERTWKGMNTDVTVETAPLYDGE